MSDLPSHSRLLKCVVWYAGVLQANQSVLVQKLRVTTVETLKQAKELGSRGKSMRGGAVCSVTFCHFYICVAVEVRMRTLDHFLKSDLCHILT